MNATSWPTSLVPSVVESLDLLAATFPDSTMVASADGAGGARVIVDPVDVGSVYVGQYSWIGGHLVAQLPYADVYPLFVRGDLARRDGRTLGVGLSPGHVFEGRPAVQASRRSTRKDPSIETVATKFLKVAEWLRQHPGA
jgi:hypothetical protein